MPSLRNTIAVLAFGVPMSLACVAKDALPKATETISNPEPIEVPAGEVFDGKGARYDRGAGACKEQEEGGKATMPFNFLQCYEPRSCEAINIFQD